MSTFTENEVNFLTSNLDQEKLLALRIKALDLAMQIATQAKKPTHAPYIAANVYKFLLTGEGPVFERKEDKTEGSES